MHQTALRKRCNDDKNLLPIRISYHDYCSAPPVEWSNQEFARECIQICATKNPPSLHSRPDEKGFIINWPTWMIRFFKNPQSKFGSQTFPIKLEVSQFSQDALIENKAESLRVRNPVLYFNWFWFSLGRDLNPKPLGLQVADALGFSLNHMLCEWALIKSITFFSSLPIEAH
jgi:hypothetical protein